MRDPVFPADPVSAVTIFSGNQFQGGGNPGNQLQDGSALFFKPAAETAWQTVPLIYSTTIGNNKYYSAPIPAGAFAAGAVVQYYLCIAYDDHDTTFLQAAADDMTSVTTGDQTAAQASPFTFTVETPDKRGQWGEPFPLPNVCIHAHVLPSGLVLMWGRRDNPQQSMDTNPASPLAPGLPPAPPATCTPFVWNPANGLLVAGGHLADSHGLNQATIYDPAGTWTPTGTMNNGRWYPTALTLPAGNILVVSGSYFDPGNAVVVNNTVSQRGAPTSSSCVPASTTRPSVSIAGAPCHQTRPGASRSPEPVGPVAMTRSRSMPASGGAESRS